MLHKNKKSEPYIPNWKTWVTFAAVKVLRKQELRYLHQHFLLFYKKRRSIIVKDSFYTNHSRKDAKEHDSLPNPSRKPLLKVTSERPFWISSLIVPSESPLWMSPSESLCVFQRRPQTRPFQHPENAIRLPFVNSFFRRASTPGTCSGWQLGVSN